MPERPNHRYSNSKQIRLKAKKALKQKALQFRIKKDCALRLLHRIVKEKKLINSSIKAFEI
jgi:hypothetical protein